MQKLDEALSEYPGDVYLYAGGVNRTGYHLLSDCLEKRTSKREKVCLVLITYGGDPDAAYRMARALHHHYPQQVEVLIPDVCKSAGTLLCIGANRLIFGDRGELGPLDIQLSKPDEMFESMSGLDIVQAINLMQTQVLEAFRSYLVDIRSGSRIRTKTAAEIATHMANGFVSPIAAKIDPITLGEHQRAMQIAMEYGDRLNKMSCSLKPGALSTLIASYPSHGFVIDRKEASELFVCVAKPDHETESLYGWAREILPKLPYNTEHAIVLDVRQELEIVQKTQSNLGENRDDGLTENPDGEEDGRSTELSSLEGNDESSSQESSGNEPFMDDTAAQVRTG